MTRAKPIPAGSPLLGGLMNAAYALRDADAVRKSRFADFVWHKAEQGLITQEAHQQVVEAMKDEFGRVDTFLGVAEDVRTGVVVVSRKEQWGP